MKKLPLIFMLWLVVLLAVGTGGPALAAPVTILNASFEDPTISEGNYTYSITDWTLSSTGGTVNFGSWLPAPDGNNVAWAGGATSTNISQILSATIQANYTYTLSVYAGSWTYSNPTYEVQLVASESNTVLDYATGAAPAHGYNFLQFEYTSDSLYAGQHLKIVLKNTGTAEVDFDLVSLDATPVPVPASLFLLGSGLVGLLVLRRRA
jgi:hypothetical protein